MLTLIVAAIAILFFYIAVGIYLDARDAGEGGEWP